MFEVRLLKQPRKYLQKVPEKVRRGFYTCFEKLEKDPYRIAEPLYGLLRGKWKVRTGDFRLILDINPEIRRIKVIYIGPRGDIYK